jgi:hypothetical protein
MREPLPHTVGWAGSGHGVDHLAFAKLYPLVHLVALAWQSVDTIPSMEVCTLTDVPPERPGLQLGVLSLYCGAWFDGSP